MGLFFCICPEKWALYEYSNQAGSCKNNYSGHLKDALITKEEGNVDLPLLLQSSHFSVRLFTKSENQDTACFLRT